MPLQQGCAVFGASTLGYMEVNSKYTNLYNDYKAKQEEAGKPVKEYKEWLKGQPLSRRELKLFKMYGPLSRDEARDIVVKEEMEKAEEPE